MSPYQNERSALPSPQDHGGCMGRLPRSRTASRALPGAVGWGGTEIACKQSQNHRTQEVIRGASRCMRRQAMNTGISKVDYLSMLSMFAIIVYLWLQ